MEDRWKKLAEFLQKEPLVLNTRTSASELKNLYDQGLAVKKEHRGEIIAFKALWPDGNGCLELGSAWVKPEWRGRKISSRLMEEISQCGPGDKILFSITHNPKIVHLLRKNNWKEVLAEEWEEVIPFSSSCGPCDRLPEDQKKLCPYKVDPEECLMFYL